MITHYSFNTPDIEGYDYIKVEGPIEGYFGEENPIITFVYKKEEVPVKPNDKEEQKPQAGITGIRRDLCRRGSLGRAR